MKGCRMNIVAELQLKLTMRGWLLALPALAVLCAAVQACQSQVSLPLRREFAWTGDMKQRHEIQGFSTSTSLISEKAKPRRLEGNSGTSLEGFSKAREELRFSSRFASISNFTMASLPTSCATWMGQVAFIRTTWYTSLRSLGSFKSAKPWRSRNAFTSFLRIGISVIGVASNHNTKTKLARSWAKVREQYHRLNNDSQRTVLESRFTVVHNTSADVVILLDSPWRFQTSQVFGSITSIHCGPSQKGT